MPGTHFKYLAGRAQAGFSMQPHVYGHAKTFPTQSWSGNSDNESLETF
jgi:hypothetical protein